MKITLKKSIYIKKINSKMNNKKKTKILSQINHKIKMIF